nr:MAG TPA: hypothetical protein [Caudoviricetes sp.]
MLGFAVKYQPITEFLSPARTLCVIVPEANTALQR